MLLAKIYIIVIGTLSILEFAIKYRVKPLLYVSTLSVTTDFHSPSLPSVEQFAHSNAFKQKHG